MVKKLVVSLLVFLTLSALFITYAFISYAPSAPVFFLQNITEQPIKVLAKWRDKSKTFKLAAKQETEFTVNDEASMDFIVTFQNSKSISGTLGYFTTGTKTKVVITETEIKIDSGV